MVMIKKLIDKLIYKLLLYTYRNEKEVLLLLENKDRLNLLLKILERGENMGNVFVDNKNDFNYQKSLNHLLDIQSFMKSYGELNNYSVVMKGYPLPAILELSKKDQIQLLMKLIQYTNPLYSFTSIIPTESKTVEIVMVSPLLTRDILHILDRVYSLCIDYSFEYKVNNSYSLNVVEYTLSVNSNNIYSTLVHMINIINEELYQYIKNDIDNPYYELLYKKYTSEFIKLYPDIDKLKKIPFGHKDEILTIVNNNKNFIINMNTLLLQNTYKKI